MKHQNWNKSLEWTESCSKHLLFLVMNQVNIDTIVLLKYFGFWKTFISIFVKISNHLMQIGLSSRTVVPLLDWVIVRPRRKQFWKHCCQIQIFVCLSKLNLALRATVTMSFLYLLPSVVFSHFDFNSTFSLKNS